MEAITSSELITTKVLYWHGRWKEGMVTDVCGERARCITVKDSEGNGFLYRHPYQIRMFGRSKALEFDTRTEIILEVGTSMSDDDMDSFIVPTFEVDGREWAYDWDSYFQEEVKTADAADLATSNGNECAAVPMLSSDCYDSDKDSEYKFDEADLTYYSSDEYEHSVSRKRLKFHKEPVESPVASNSVCTATDLDETQVTPTTSKRQYNCDLCSSHFSTPAEVKRHAWMHSGAKQYVCKICTKGFSRLGFLERHMKTHDGMRKRKRKRVRLRSIEQDGVWPLHAPSGSEDSTSGKKAHMGISSDEDAGPVISDKKRKNDKRYYCLYCRDPQAKLPRHLETVHKDEEDVIRLLNASGSERLGILTMLRNKGNHQHNNEVIKTGSGEIAVVYRVKGVSSLPLSQYVPCTHCLGWFYRPELWKHIKRCTLKQSLTICSKGVVRAGEMLKDMPSKVSDRFKKVLMTFRKDDDVADFVKQDKLLCELGERLTMKHGHDADKFMHIRSKLRLMGRLLLEIKKQNPTIRTAQDSVHPKHFVVILAAARKMSGFSAKENLFDTPSSALKIGTTYVKVIEVLMSTAIERGDAALKERCRELKELFDIRWKSEFNANAHRSNVEKKKNTINIVPLTEDVKKLSAYLKAEMISCRSALEKNPSCKASYSRLLKVILASIIIFNRRRSGEVSRMKVQEYEKNTSGSQTVSQHDLDLTPLERQFVDSYTRVELTGKKGRTVAILLSQSIKESLDILVKFRNLVDVPKYNQHLFCTLTSDGYIRGTAVIREFSERCGAVRPEALRSTKLRKHIATMTQILNFDNNELDILAKFMGHDINVHRDYYRLPDEVVQVAKLSKFLIAAERGEMANYRGKRLEEIPFPEDELEAE